MSALKIAEMIEHYMTDDRQRYIDALNSGEHYVVKGKFMDGPDGDERLEVGKYGDASLLFEPLVQLRLGDVPKYESRRDSCFDVDGFSGTIYRLTEDEYTSIENEYR